MNKRLLKEAIGWGFIVWLIGYILGIIFFAIFPPNMIGWVIMPIGVVIALLVLIKKVKSSSLRHFLIIAASWTLIAVIGDYFFLVKIFNPADGYYKLDVYLYYALTFILPLAVFKTKSRLTPDI